MELVSYQCNFKSPTCSLAVLLIHILSDSLTYRLIYSLILFTAHSSTQSLPHLFPPTPTRLPYTLSLTHKLPTLFLVCLVVRSIIRFLFWSPAHSLTRSLAHSPTHPLIHWDTNSLINSMRHSLADPLRGILTGPSIDVLTFRDAFNEVLTHWPIQSGKGHQQHMPRARTLGNELVRKELPQERRTAGVPRMSGNPKAFTLTVNLSNTDIFRRLVCYLHYFTE